MPKAARKSKVRNVPDDDITIGDVTDRVYPEGTPQNPDGTVQDGGAIPVAQAQQVGALTASAAATNRKVARQIDRASKGESVSWNDDDPLNLFEGIRAAWPGVSVRIHIKCVDSEEVFPPPQMSAFKSSAEFYDHLVKNVHRNRKSARYEITFKAGANYSIRGKGYIVMPDMTEVTAAQPQQAVFNPYTGQWQAPVQQAPVPMPYPQYSYPQQPQQSQQPQQVQQQPPNIVIHNPLQPQSPMAMPPIAVPPSADPGMQQWMQQLINEQQQTRLQLAAALGAAEEYKRRSEMQQSTPPVAATAPQQVQVPPGYQPIPGYIPPGYQPPPGYQLIPLGAPPIQPQVVAPPPPPLPQQVQKPANPFGIDLPTVMNAMESFKQIQKVLGSPNPARTMEELEEDDDAPMPPPPPPTHIVTTKLGDGENPMVYTTNPDGSINWTGMIAGNMHKLPEFFERMAKSAASIDRQINDAAMRRPIQASGHAVVERPRMAPPPPSIHQQIHQPQPEIVEIPQQQVSLIPNLPRS